MRCPFAHSPPVLVHVWDWFHDDLVPFYSGNGWSITPLSWREVDAWSALTGRRLSPLEARALMDLDRVYRDWLERRVPPRAKDAKANVAPTAPGNAPLVAYARADDPVAMHRLFKGLRKKLSKGKNGADAWQTTSPGSDTPSTPAGLKKAKRRSTVSLKSKTPSAPPASD